MGIKHIKNNVRVLLINNGGGAEFHIVPSHNELKTIDGLNLWALSTFRLMMKLIFEKN